MPKPYRRTTTASRRAERVTKFLHVSAPIITIPVPGTTLTKAAAMRPGITYDVGRNKAKAEIRACKAAYRAAKARA